MIKWDPKRVGKALRKARLEHGWSMNAMANRTGIKSQTISRIERGVMHRPPKQATRQKLEAELGIDLLIPQNTSRTISVYIPPEEIGYLEEARSAFPDKNASQAVLEALKAWSEHRAILAKWKKEHDVNYKYQIERIAMKHYLRNKKAA